MDLSLFYVVIRSDYCSVNNTRSQTHLPSPLCPRYKQYPGLSTAISDQVKNIYYPHSASVET